jgi:hypothetical protein
MPAAAINEAGSTWITKLPPLEGIAEKSVIATASNDNPATMLVFIPMRLIIRADAPTIKIIIAAVIGSSASPLSNGP